MQYQLRYSGEFVSRKGVIWQCNILQRSAVPYSSVGELRFEAEEPLCIDWHSVDKETPLQSSSATLKIESPADRTYTDLYTIEVGAVRLDVLRDGKLFWSGTLDPEFYEEPYERAALYPVTLTFSDFGCLDRLKFDSRGVLPLSQIVETILAKSGLHYDALDYSSLCSLCFPSEDAGATYESATLDKLAIVADNFYDEEGEPSSLREVLEGILQPLALRMVQRGGKVLIYDLNSIAKLTPKPIYWTGDSQTLGVDKVANSVRINFSAYAKAGAITDKVEFRGKYTGFEHETLIMPVDREVEGTYEDGKFYLFFQHTTPKDKPTGLSFESRDFVLYTSAKGRGAERLHPAARYGHFFPLLSNANETDCIVWRAQALPYPSRDTTKEEEVGVLNPAAANFPPTATIFSTRSTYIPRIEGTKLNIPNSATFYPCNIGIQMDIFADPRYNPFLDAKGFNEQTDYNGIKANTWIARVPIGVGLYDADGNPLYHLKRLAYSAETNTGYLLGQYVWEVGAPSYSDRVFLDYGSENDAIGDCGLFGWKKNGLIANPTMQEADTDTYPNGTHNFGLKVPYPPSEGWLRVDVYEGLYCFDNTEQGQEWMAGINGANPCVKWNKAGYYDHLRWLLYKVPEVTVYSHTTAGTKADLEDIEYSGYINRSAKEEISIDTICGTHTVASPSARGVLLRTCDHLQLHRLHRAGHTDHPERLLIGTLISQYSHRMTTLKGEYSTAPRTLVYSEANQAGKLFIVKDEVLNAQTDTSESTFVEFCPDEWTAIEEVEEYPS